MNTNYSKPAWWVLYALVALMALALAFDCIDGLPNWVNEIMTLGIVVLVFSGMALWVHMNQSGLVDEELRNIQPEEYHVTEYFPYRLDEDLANEIYAIVQAREERPK
jgi:hypothetical protein